MKTLKKHLKSDKVDLQFQYSTKYQPKEIISTIIESKQNVNLVKHKTGSGLTHGILSLENQRIILVMPNVSLVKAKETAINDRTHKELASPTDAKFHYGSSADNILHNQPRKQGESHFIVGTIDQIVKKGFRYLPFAEAGYTLIIDEIDHIQEDSSRESIWKRIEMLVNTFKENSNVITGTATPQTIKPTFLEENFKNLRVINTNDSNWNNVEITENKKDVSAFVIETIKDNKQLIMFSNSESMFNKQLVNLRDKKLIDYDDNYMLEDVVLISGASIQETTRTKGIFKYFNLSDINESTKIVCITSTGFQGIDINLEDPNVVLYSDLSYEPTFISHTGIVQALGRNRTGFNNGLVYIGGKKNKNTLKKEMDERLKRETNKIKIAALKESKHAIDMCTDYNEISRYLESFKYRAFASSLNKRIYQKDGKIQKMSLGQMINNVNSSLEYYENDLDNAFKTASKNIGLSNKVFGLKWQAVAAITITKIFKDFELDIEMAISIFNATDTNRMKSDILEVLKYVYENKDYDFSHIRGVEKAVKSSLDRKSSIKFGKKQVSNGIFGISISDIMKSDTDIAIENLAVMYAGLSAPIGIKEFLKDKGDTQNSLSEKEAVKRGTDLRFELHKAYIRNFNSISHIELDGREYNIMTRLGSQTSALLCPTSSIEIDITAATTSFIINVFGLDTTAEWHYEHIMKKHEIKRVQAKKMLNTWYNTVPVDEDDEIEKERWLEESAGFDRLTVRKICKIGEKRGNFFRLYAKFENEAISTIRSLVKGWRKDLNASFRYGRLHDAIFIFGREDELRNLWTIVNDGEKKLTISVDIDGHELSVDFSIDGVLGDGEYVKLVDERMKKLKTKAKVGRVRGKYRN